MLKQLVYAQVRLKNGVTEASHAEYLQAKKRAWTGDTILDGISLLDDDASFLIWLCANYKIKIY
jgi:hypothetical protein